MTNKLPTTLLLVLLFLMISVPPSHALWWMVYHKPAFKGKVIDAETKEPIEGAVVVVTYSKTSIGIAESYSVIIKVKETLTDKNGEFYIPSDTTMTQPLSWEDMANFIIFKPGYDRWQGYQSLPYGIRPIDEEIFFSKGIGTEGELEMWVKGGPPPILRKSKVTFGIVELPKLKTREDRLKAMPSHLTDESKTPILNRLIDEEDHNLGLK